MNLITITDNIATIAGTITGIRGASGQELDTIPGTPYVVVGLPKALEVLPGNRQITNMAIPVYLLIERLSDQKRDLRVAYGYVPTFVTTFASNQGLSSALPTGTIDAYVNAWDTNTTYSIGGATYWAVDFTLYVTVHEPVTQSL